MPETTTETTTSSTVTALKTAMDAVGVAADELVTQFEDGMPVRIQVNRARYRLDLAVKIYEEARCAATR